MTPQVEVTDQSGAGVDTVWVSDLVAGVLRAERTEQTFHVVLVDDAEMRRLHRLYRDQDSTTDVLSFPLAADADEEDAWDPDGEGPSAEVVVSVDTARREALARGVDFRAELALYLIHGVLHILGYDDEDDATRFRMRAAEAEHLDAAGFPRELYQATRRRAPETERRRTQ